LRLNWRNQIPAMKNQRTFRWRLIFSIITLLMI
jgi:hypothetical protein